MWAYKNKNRLLILILAVGFLLGIIYENIVLKSNAVTVELFLRSNLERYMQTEIIAEKYLWYVVKARVLLLFIICIFSCIKWKKLFVILCLFVVGGFAGVLTVSAVLQLGMKGILLCIAGVFPQGIFYGMMYGMLFVHWFRYPERQWNRAKFIFVTILFLLGIIVETYVNPLIVKGVIKIL